VYKARKRAKLRDGYIQTPRSSQRALNSSRTSSFKNNVTFGWCELSYKCVSKEILKRTTHVSFVMSVHLPASNSALTGPIWMKLGMTRIKQILFRRFDFGLVCHVKGIFTYEIRLHFT
jgi:hypothetical protein